LNYTVLASGSSGNCTYLQTGEHAYLIDAGLSLRQIVSRLDVCNLVPSRIHGIFITHEHGDHISGLVTINHKYHCPIYLTEGTLQGLPSRIREAIPQADFRVIRYFEPITFPDLTVTPIMTYHDAIEPCGYKFASQGKTLVYITDCGYYPEKSYDVIRNADHYILESNHDPELLLESDRTWMLKRRIMDDQGHLSNEDSAYLLANVLGEKTKTIVLAHLSQECNTDEHALAAYRDVFTKQGLVVRDFKILCAHQDVPNETEEL